MAPMAMFQYHSTSISRIPQITITATDTANSSNWQTSSVNKLCNLIKCVSYQDFSSAKLEADCWPNWSLAIMNALAFKLLLLIFDNGTSNQPRDNLLWLSQSRMFLGRQIKLLWTLHWLMSWITLTNHSGTRLQDNYNRHIRPTQVQLIFNSSTSLSCVNWINVFPRTYFAYVH